MLQTKDLFSDYVKVAKVINDLYLASQLTESQMDKAVKVGDRVRQVIREGIKSLRTIQIGATDMSRIDELRKQIKELEQEADMLYDALDLDHKVAHLMRRLLSGAPTELTEASEEVYKVRDILEEEGFWVDPDTGEEYDFGGSVYWSGNKTVAVIVFD